MTLGTELSITRQSLKMPNNDPRDRIVYYSAEPQDAKQLPSGQNCLSLGRASRCQTMTLGTELSITQQSLKMPNNDPRDRIVYHSAEPQDVKQRPSGQNCLSLGRASICQTMTLGTELSITWQSLKMSNNDPRDRTVYHSAEPQDAKQ